MLSALLRLPTRRLPWRRLLPFADPQTLCKEIRSFSRPRSVWACYFAEVALLKLNASSLLAFTWCQLWDLSKLGKCSSKPWHAVKLFTVTDLVMVRSTKRKCNCRRVSTGHVSNQNCKQIYDDHQDYAKLDATENFGWSWTCVRKASGTSPIQNSFLLHQRAWNPKARLFGTFTWLK